MRVWTEERRIAFGAGDLSVLYLYAAEGVRRERKRPAAAEMEAAFMTN